MTSKGHTLQWEGPPVKRCRSAGTKENGAQSCEQSKLHLLSALLRRQATTSWSASELLQDLFGFFLHMVFI